MAPTVMKVFFVLLPPPPPPPPLTFCRDFFRDCSTSPLVTAAATATTGASSCCYFTTTVPTTTVPTTTLPPLCYEYSVRRLARRTAGAVLRGRCSCYFAKELGCGTCGRLHNFLMSSTGCTSIFRAWPRRPPPPQGLPPTHPPCSALPLVTHSHAAANSTVTCDIEIEA